MSLPHFPLADDVFGMTVGARPLDGAPLMLVDEPAYYRELALKHAQLADQPGRYFQALPATEAMQWEALELVLSDLALHHPAHFGLERAGAEWQWENRLLNSLNRLRLGDTASLPLAPLDWLGRQVQEDLLLLDAGSAGVPLVAGQLCFGNGWELGEKLGQPFLNIHEPVPHFNAQIGRPSLLLMERLKPDRPVWRVNWAVKAVDQLNLPPAINRALAPLKGSISAENAGQRCFFRVERQTLSRLPRSNGVLFGIHTYQVAIAELVSEPAWARRLLGVLRTIPPATLDYKGIVPFSEPLIAYIEQFVHE